MIANKKSGVSNFLGAQRCFCPGVRLPGCGIILVNANETANTRYQPVNTPLVTNLPGNPDTVDLNRRQPLTLDIFRPPADDIPGRIIER